MGRIYSFVTITNPAEPDKAIRVSALVDSSAAHLVLPSAWRERLGVFPSSQQVELETANQTTITGEICGPVPIQLEGFRAIHNEVLFVEMTPEDGIFEPLIGYIVLEQSQAAVDTLGHRLIHERHAALK